MAVPQRDQYLRYEFQIRKEVMGLARTTCRSNGRLGRHARMNEYHRLEHRVTLLTIAYASSSSESRTEYSKLGSTLADTENNQRCGASAGWVDPLSLGNTLHSPGCWGRYAERCHKDFNCFAFCDVFAFAFTEGAMTYTQTYTTAPCGNAIRLLHLVFPIAWWMTGRDHHFVCDVFKGL